MHRSNYEAGFATLVEEREDGKPYGAFRSGFEVHSPAKVGLYSKVNEGEEYGISVYEGSLAMIKEISLTEAPDRQHMERGPDQRQLGLALGHVNIQGEDRMDTVTCSATLEPRGGAISNLRNRASGLPSGAGRNAAPMMRHVGSAQQLLGLPSIFGHQGKTKPIADSRAGSDVHAILFPPLPWSSIRRSSPSIHLVVTDALNDSLAVEDGLKERGGHDSSSTGAYGLPGGYVAHNIQPG
ncbi:hypothetical protein BKA70DRAFT_1439420 [Coprinopsis sp. MPI-PUGE-AT-0042]|nr:hypothetical protein BKA70DRAFT_1439420 [Coprinopsis sp. MPI-PUGE-AT-0042]